MDECFEPDSLAKKAAEVQDKKEAKARDKAEAEAQDDAERKRDEEDQAPYEPSEESAMTIQKEKTATQKETMPVSLSQFKKIYQHWCYENSLHYTQDTIRIKAAIIQHYARKDFFGKDQTNYVKIIPKDVTRITHLKWKPGFVSRVFLAAYSCDEDEVESGKKVKGEALRRRNSIQEHEDAISKTKWDRSLKPLIRDQRRFEILPLLPLETQRTNQQYGRKFNVNCLWRMFVFECIDESESDQDYVTWRDPGHNLSQGDARDNLTMEIGLQEWLKIKGCAHKFEDKFDDKAYKAAVIDEFGWGPNLDGARNQVQQICIRKIQGTELIIDKRSKAQTPNCSFYFWNFLDVAIHQAVCVAVPALLLIRLLQMQFLYSRTLASVNGAEPLMWYDGLHHGVSTEMFSLYGKHVIPLFYVTLLALICYLAFIFLRMLRHYCDHGENTKACGFRWGKLISLLGGYLLGVFSFAFTSYILLVLAWSLMAAILSPSEYLVYGVAVAVGVLVIAFAFSALKSTVATFIDALKHGLRQKVQKQLDMAVKERAVSNAERVRTNKPISDTETGEFSPEHLFAALNVKEDGKLTKEDFRKFFDDLDMKLDDKRLDTLIAIVDENNDNLIDSEVCTTCLRVMLQPFMVLLLL